MTEHDVSPEEEAEARWLDSDDEDAPPPWSTLGALAQLLVALIAVALVIAGLLALAGVVSWIFR